MYTDEQKRIYLEVALEEARVADRDGNYPIGSLVVDGSGEILAKAHNECTSGSDVSAHAEILCIRMLKDRVNKDTHGELTLFSSLEPCFGCSFFLARTNIKTVISALKDPHKGGMSMLQNNPDCSALLKHITVINEPFEDLKTQSLELMKNYFLKLNRHDAAKYYE